MRAILSAETGIPEKDMVLVSYSFYNNNNDEETYAYSKQALTNPSKRLDWLKQDKDAKDAMLEMLGPKKNVILHLDEHKSVVDVMAVFHSHRTRQVLRPAYFVLTARADNSFLSSRDWTRLCADNKTATTLVTQMEDMLIFKIK